MSSRADREARLVALACALVTFFSQCPAALANGRYPAAQQVLIDPSNPSRLWLRTTYGLQTSSNAGKSWSWICEGAVGYDPAEDPMLAITADGRVLVGASTGFFETTDHGCGWTPSTEIGNRFVRDIAVEGDGGHVLALTTTREQDGNAALALFRSDASAHALSQVGTTLSLDLIGTTLDPAPSDSSRIYVTGAVNPIAPSASPSDVTGLSDASAGDAAGASFSVPTGRAYLLRSRDGGAAWERRPIPGASSLDLPYIAAVHPTNPDVVYVRVQGAAPDAGNVQSWLLYTDDAGDTWREIFRASADMPGFALTPDGSAALVGMGDLHDFSRPVDASVLGIYRGDAPGFAFARVLTGQIGCLAYGPRVTDAGTTAPSLYLCGGHTSEGYELAVSTNDGVTASSLFDLGDISGPLACSATTPVARLCENEWQYVCGGQGVLGPCSGADAGASAPAASGGGSGCGCGSPGSAPTSTSPKTGTARLGMVPDSWVGMLAMSAIVAALVRRRARR